MSVNLSEGLPSHASPHHGTCVVVVGCGLLGMWRWRGHEAATCLPTPPPGLISPEPLMLPLQLGFKYRGGSTCLGRTTEGVTGKRCPSQGVQCKGQRRETPRLPQAGLSVNVGEREPVESSSTIIAT